MFEIILQLFYGAGFPCGTLKSRSHRGKGCSKKLLKKLVSEVVPNVISGAKHFDFSFLEGFLD